MFASGWKTALLPSVFLIAVAINASAVDHNGDLGLFTFVTRPDIRAPKWRVNVHRPELVTPGHWFVAPYESLSEDGVISNGWVGPHIYDQSGELIWSGVGVVDNGNTFDFRVSNVEGRDMMTLLWQKAGNGLILDNDYTVVRALDIYTTMDIEPHEFNFVDDGKHALVTTLDKGQASLEESKDAGYELGECKVSFKGFEELDVQTGEPSFHWNPKGRIHLVEGTSIPFPIKFLCDGLWDYMHTNSIDKTPEGDYLMSSRHTDTVYKISGQDGSILWRLGGKKSDFDQGDLKFSRQHDIRFRGQNETHTIISFLDNAKGEDNAPTTHDRSRALVVALETNTFPKTATVVQAYDHPSGAGAYAHRRGNVQILSNGNAFVGWSEQAHHSEHTAEGELIMDARLEVDWMGSYRNYKFDGFVGRPKEDIAVVAEFAEPFDVWLNGLIVHVSWNGATEVASWRLSHTTSDGTVVEELSSKPKKGFETKLWHSKAAQYIVVEALAADGQVLRSSPVTETSGEFGTVWDDSSEKSQADKDEQADKNDQGVVSIKGAKSNRGKHSGRSTLLFFLGIVCGVVSTMVVSHMIRKGRISGKAFGRAEYFLLQHRDSTEEV